MNIHDPAPDDLAPLLKQNYDSTPDPAFAADLLQRLQPELPHRAGAWRVRILAAAAIALACTIGATAYLHSQPQTPAPVAGKPDPSAVILNNPNDHPAIASADPSESDSMPLREKMLMASSLTELVGRSPYWVRCRPTRFESPLAHYTVVYSIYGDFPDQTVTVDLSTGPADRNLADFAGTPDRDLVLELRPRKGAPKSPDGTESPYQYLGTHYLADEAEAEILQGVTDGSSFDINPRRVDQQFLDAQLVVRAQLIQATSGESQWKITGILRGGGMVGQGVGGNPEKLIFDDQFFRQRAKAIVAAATRKQEKSTTRQIPGPAAASQPATTQTNAQLVDTETTRLTSVELTPAVEAILFVDQLQSNPDSVHARLRYRSYEDAAKQKLDKLQEAITQPQPAIKRL